jgi:carotenoid cleavage dioxygenase-like enzyme
MEVTSGEFPSWLQGTKYNNGFGQFESCPAGGDCWSINHLADVMSYYSKMEVANGTVRLWSKIQKTNYWQEAQSKKPTYRTFNGTTPGFSAAEAAVAMTSMKPNDNLNVAILQLTTSGRMFGVSDMKGFNEATDSLDYAGWLTFKEKNKPIISDLPLLGIDMVTCAHIGNTLGDKYVYGFNFLLVDGLRNDLAVWRVDMTQPEDGTGSQLVREWMDTVKIPGLTHISYIHTFANTDNFLVFIGSAFQYNIEKIISNTKILNAMEWNGDKKTNIVWVYDKAAGKFIKTFTADAFWFYHLVNCYEEGSKVVMDINSVDYRHIETAFANEKLRYDVDWEFEEKPTIRLVVDTAADDGAHFSPEVIGPSFDLGTIHPNLHGQKYQYTWALGWSGKHLWYDTVMKYDVNAKATLNTWQREDHYPGELVAIAKPGGEYEDDVVVLVTMLGGDYGTSYLLALDGRDLSPIAEARSPYPLPFGSHGCWQGADKSRGCIGETTADPFGKPRQFKKRSPERLALV